MPQSTPQYSHPHSDVEARIRHGFAIAELFLSKLFELADWLTVKVIILTLAVIGGLSLIGTHWPKHETSPPAPPPVQQEYPGHNVSEQRGRVLYL